MTSSFRFCNYVICVLMWTMFCGSVNGCASSTSSRLVSCGFDLTEYESQLIDTISKSQDGVPGIMTVRVSRSWYSFTIIDRRVVGGEVRIVEYRTTSYGLPCSVTEIICDASWANREFYRICAHARRVPSFSSEERVRQIQPNDSITWHIMPQYNYIVTLENPTMHVDISHLLNNPEAPRGVLADSRMELSSASMLDTWIDLFDIRVRREAMGWSSLADIDASGSR